MEYWNKTTANRLFCKRNYGYTMVEMLVVLIIIGIIAAVAMKSMTKATDTQRTEETTQKLERLTYAISGDPNAISGGVRTDYGYIGDVGSLPSSLTNLVTTPGYSTWKGPYVRDEFSSDATGTSASITKDAWGTTLTYASSGVTIASTGGGTSITRNFGTSLNDLLRNSVRMTVSDSNGYPPGATYRDSVKVLITIPNGTGSTTTKTDYADADGMISFDSIPIGLHTLRLIYIPNNDTLRRMVNIDPGTMYTGTIQLFRSAWGDAYGGGTIGSEVFHPNASGSYEDLDDVGCSGNYDCISEISHDGDGTYILGNTSSIERDCYNIPNHVNSGTIDSVIITIYAKKSTNGQTVETMLRTSSSNYYGTLIDMDSYSSYTKFTTKYTTNPNTSSAWTWSQIDAAQIGVRIDGTARVTQIYMTVYHH